MEGLRLHTAGEPIGFQADFDLMRTWIIALLLSCSSAGTAAVDPYRFQALIDLDQDIATGCAISSAAGTLTGHELRVSALADDAQIHALLLESCRMGSWHTDHRATTALPIAGASGAPDLDLIAWSLPRAWFDAYPSLPIHWLAEGPGGAAFDLIGNDAGFSTFELSLAGSPRPVPAFGRDAAALLLIGIAGLAIQRGKRRRWLALGVVLATTAFTAGIAGSSARAAFPAIVTVPLTDPAGDNSPGGVDVVAASASADADGVHFRMTASALPTPAAAPISRVLLIGNSLTYANDLPEILEAVARQGGKSLHAQSVTGGGYNLEDHYRGRTALAEIARGHYELVILQQGPSSLAESQLDLREWTGRFDAPIRASGARPALYMVWPELERFGYFDAVRLSYRNAALDVDGMFIPAGEAWRAAWAVDPRLPFYSSDDFHPSPLGSYAAALSMYAELYQESPVGLPARIVLDNGHVLQFTATQARIVQEAAWAAHLQWGRAGH